jgi:uncharacterized protein with FMN-binding domain
MKKIVVSAFIILSFVFYSYLHNKPKDVVNTTSELPKSSAGSLNTPIPTSTTSSLYKDGEYTGPATDAYYGNIQVKAIIHSGKLTDVKFLQYPHDHRESIEINTGAMPILTQEAITAQSAEVDGITRATDTTNAFKQSLASALSQAKQ